MPKQSNKLTHTDLFKLGDLLRQHCETKDGFAVYSNGWDDTLMLELVKEKHPDMKVNVNNVAGLRKALMGNVRAPRGNKVTVETLLARIEALEVWAGARPVQGFKKT